MAILSGGKLKNNMEPTSQSYLPNGDVYGQNRYTAYAHNLSVNTNHNWTFNREWVNFILRPTLSFSKTKGDKASLAAMAEHELFSNATLDTLLAPDVTPDKLGGIINRTKSLQKHNGHNLLTGMQMQASIKLPHTMDKLMVEARGYYTDNQQYNYNHKLYDYPKETSATDLRNEYGRNGVNNQNAHRISFGIPHPCSNSIWLTPTVGTAPTFLFPHSTSGRAFFFIPAWGCLVRFLFLSILKLFS